MQSPEKPKRRMVVYVTEDTFSNLQKIAKAENRSVSNVAEGKIILGLRAGSDRIWPGIIIPVQTGQGRSGPDSEDLKASVIDVLDNLSPESLTHFAEKLARILDRPALIQTKQDWIGQDRTRQDQTGSQFVKVEGIRSFPPLEESEHQKENAKDVAARLAEFVKKNRLSQRWFREIYDFDLTRLNSWLSGECSMSQKMIGRIEAVLSSNSITM